MFSKLSRNVKFPNCSFSIVGYYQELFLFVVVGFFLVFFFND